MIQAEYEQIHMPLIGDDAPAFKAVTTEGPINFPDDYKGKWVILFSHPADFTPVCTTEFMTFASMQEDFRKINTELIDAPKKIAAAIRKTSCGPNQIKLVKLT